MEITKDKITEIFCIINDFKGYAEIGKSTMGWYFGFKLHLICNERGELLNFMLTKANVDDRNTEVFNRLSDNVSEDCSQTRDTFHKGCSKGCSTMELNL